MAARGGESTARLILKRRQHRIIEGRDEDIVDQIAHRLAAAAMGERHLRHMDPSPALSARPGWEPALI